MTLTEDLTEKPLISEYTTEAFRFKETLYPHNILILPSGEVLPWAVQDLAHMSVEDCKKIMQYKPEIVIIGTGALHQLPDLSIVRYFSDYNRGVEIMNTSAACRTYNVLALEGRLVVAGLIL